MATIIDLGKQIKQQYPTYANLSDEEVGRKVKLKDPIKYSAFTDVGGGSNDIWGDNNIPQQTSVEKPQEKMGIFKGIAKGIGSTAFGAGQLLGKVVGKITGQEDITADKPKPEFLTPQTSQEKVGFYGEQIAEFLMPTNISSKVSGVVKGAKLLSKAPGFIRKTAPLISKMATEAGIVGGQTTLQQGELNDTAKTGAIIAAAFPVLGKATSGILGATGKKIQETVIKPSINDVKNGFKIETINKYNLGGGLKTMLVKTTNKLNELSRNLKSTLGNNKGEIDLADVYYDTAADLLKNKTKNFGNIKAINRVLTNLADELDEVAPGLKADLEQATNIKRGAGTKGSWVYGSADPDSSAVESVYNKFYHKLKVAIEKNGTKEIQEINKKLSELIPVQNALLRRIPIAERNNLLSLTDNIGLFASIFDPRALALIGVKKLSMSGNVGNILVKANALLKKAPLIGERLTK